ncbi:hypothetical protein [Okeania sp. KiyG1]|nr:hypothetical protein [Okeania sp. KiyG1]
MGRWGDGVMGRNPPLTPPRRGMWGDRKRFGNGASVGTFFYTEPEQI